MSWIWGLNRGKNRENEKLDIEATTSAQEALEILENKNFDIIVSDYQMPEMDGLEFLEIIRKEGKSDIPFIIFTGEGRKEVAMEAANLGVDQYLKKEGKAKELFERLSKSVIELIKEREEKPDGDYLIAWIEKKSYANPELAKYDLRKLAEKTGFKVKKIEMYKSPFKPDYEVIKAYTSTFEKVPSEKADEAREWISNVVWPDDIRDASVVIEGRAEKEKTKKLKETQTSGTDISEKGSS